jgi:hypothetical protein
MKEAKVRKAVGSVVMLLVEALDSVDAKDETKRGAVEVFSKLALGHAIVPTKSDESWVPVRAGAIKVADEVRVRDDAFDGDLGRLHNGRRGVVVAVRYGDVIIKTTDGKKPILSGAHYPPDKLEKLVRK